MSGPLLVHGAARAWAYRPEGSPKHLRLPLGPVAILMSPSRLSGQEEPDAQEALRHNCILLAAALNGGVIPVRFGMAVSSPEAAADALAPLAEKFACALKRLDGRVEYVVRLSRRAIDARPEAPALTGRTDDPAGGGRAWLQARALRRRTSKEDDPWGDDAIRRLAEAADLVRADRRGGGAPRLDLTLLCHRDEREEALREAAEATRLADPGLVLDLSGPWPAYASADALMDPAV